VVKLLDRTHLRVGNAEYVRENKSFGLSTLLDQHVAFDGGKLFDVLHVRLDLSL